MKIKTILIIVIFCGLLSGQKKAPEEANRIQLKPNTFKAGEKVTVTFGVIKNNQPVKSATVSGGVDSQTLFSKTYSNVRRDEQAAPSFTWTAASGKHTIWFTVKGKKRKDPKRFEKEVDVRSE